MTNVEKCQYGGHCHLPHTGANLTTVLIVVAIMLLLGVTAFALSRTFQR